MPSNAKILSQAVTLTWRQRRLWWWALAMTWITTIAELEIIQRSVGVEDSNLLISLWRNLAGSGLFNAKGVAALAERAQQRPIDIIVFVLILAVTALVTGGLTWLSIVAQGAYVHGAAYAEAGRLPKLASGFALGRKKFWPLAWLNVGYRFAVMVIFFVLLQFLLTLPWFWFLPLFVAGSMAALGLSILFKFAVAAVILENKNMAAACALAQRLLRAQWQKYLALTGMLFFLTLLATIMLRIIVVLALIPFLLLLGTSQTLNFVAGGQLYFYLSWATEVGIMTLFALLIVGLHWSTWTVAYVHGATGHKQN